MSNSFRRAVRGRSPAFGRPPAGECLEADVEALRARGVEIPGGIDEMPWARVARLADPDGNELILQTATVDHAERAAIMPAESLRVRFGDTVALDELTVDAPSAGVITALLGPNGAGKTTLVRCIATRQPYEHGSLHVADIDVRQEPARVRRRIGRLVGRWER